MDERLNPIYGYKITPQSFFCYVIYPDLELCAIAITDKIYYMYGNKGIREVTLEDKSIKFKFSEEAIEKAREWKNKYLKD